MYYSVTEWFEPGRSIWKVENETGHVECECRTKEQAERIVRALEQADNPMRVVNTLEDDIRKAIGDRLSFGADLVPELKRLVERLDASDDRYRQLVKTMMTPFEDVAAFHRKFGQAIGRYPGFPPHELFTFRVNLVIEEFTELLVGLGFAKPEIPLMFCDADKDLVEVADAIADLIYVLCGMALCFGIDLRLVWQEVHRSNMAKTGGPLRSDDKILKPEGWTPPDVSAALKASNLLDLALHTR